MTQKAKNRYDAAFGCLLGGCVGDAAGATLEFIRHKPSLAEVKVAMKMFGGGVWGLAPGQITDDSELALCLAQALSLSSTFDLETIAQHYAKWVESEPFDMGMTTSQSLGCFLSSKWKSICNQQGYAVGMSQAASQLCMGSKANGSLMRIAPLGVWGHRFDDNELAHFAEQDSSLSHPNESCRHAVACYVIAISSLINKPGDRKLAFERAYNWAVSHGNIFERAYNWATSHVNEVPSWLKDAKNNVDVPYHPHAGFLKIGLTHAFRHLLLGTDYVDAIQETLEGGGDTDTNACIVGGLIGAASDTLQGDQPRPDFLHTMQLPDITKRLLAPNAIKLRNIVGWVER
ncbi:hypothetical protein PN36_18580 [Candidatus Thiomargarita nelsonii]|uniref:ADP-ribosylglycohydrolase n=1 Tax=Candidatus Thiomargarita nelsonii TaxID=1003181 RepID=A0A4E0QN69_9GAMM|nr:hypothetical protein PN36_18580 [Candidatus Thiomargarita nelsonii]